MSSFRFNFSHDEKTPEIVQEERNQMDKKDIQWEESVEVVPGNQVENLHDMPHARMFICGDVEIGHVEAKEALLKIANDSGDCLTSAVELADKEHSDLVPGKYEGGLKIWECTNDLIEYLVYSNNNFKFTNLKVLDLGCGAGILGIYAHMNGAYVTFQDYNKEVLECITIPNVLLNSEDESSERNLSHCKFYSGDWASFNKLLPDTEMFDVILTSETIYNPDNYDKLIDLFLQRLTKDGTAFIAAKTYYFGVGGGTREFEKKIESSCLLKSEVCWSSTDGIKREILKITRNQSLLLID